ncbi:MAG: hypothetical protein QM504_02165 [Pseudomonadota bacterium]
MSKKLKGFERIRKAMAMGAAGTVGLLGFGIGTGRANHEDITVISAITTGTSYTLSSLDNSNVDGTDVLVSTAIVSTDVGESGTSSGNPTIEDTTDAYGIDDATIKGLSGTWSGINYLGEFSQGTWGVPQTNTTSSSTSTFTPTELDDAFDGYGGIFVDGAPYNDLDGSVDLTGNTVTTDMRTMPNGLVVASQYYAFSDKRLGRIIFTINNPTGSTISPRIAIGGNLGSDSNTYVAKTSNGNQTVETGDTWVVTHDSSVYSGVATRDPILTHIVGSGSATIRPFPLQIPGGGGNVPTQKSKTSEKEGDASSGHPSTDNISFGYDLVIPAGETQYITWFVQLSSSMLETDDSLPQYNDETSAMAAGLFNNLPSGMVGGGVNWAAGAPTPIPIFSPISLLVLSGLFGFAATRRLRKIK